MFCFGQEPPAVSPLFGKRIVEILFSPEDQPLSRDQLGLSLALRPGDVLTETKLAKAIEGLFLSGRYSNIVAEGEPIEGGVRIIFQTTGRYFVSRVSILGVPEPPTAGRLEGATQLDLGRPFEPEMLDAAAKRLREVLVANGFQNPSIRHQTQVREQTEEIDIFFQVDPGPRARFTAPEFAGNVKLNPKALIRETEWLKWYGLRGYKDVSETRVNKGLEKIRGAYLKKDYLQSEVRLTDLEFNPEKNTLKPKLDIEAGPRVLVRTEGEKVGQGLLRELIPIYQERTVDRELLLEGQRNLTEHFRNRGFGNPVVSYRTEDPKAPGGKSPLDQSDVVESIIYTIEKGEKVKLTDVLIAGNRYFDEETIRERLSILPAKFPRSRNGQYSQRMLEEDKDAIFALYEANGFRDARVTHQIEAGNKGKERQITVTLQVEEGRQWLVESLELRGVDLRLLETVENLVSSTKGQPFSNTQVAGDRDSVLNYYFNNGYPEATLEVSVKLDEVRKTAAVVYTVNEGRRYFVRDVLINGPRTTSMSLIRNRLAVHPLEPLSQSRIVESQRRLYDLGVFSNVDVAVQNPDGKERNKYVLMQIDEARRYSLTLGVGAELGRIGGGSNFDAPAGATGFSPRGLIGISRSNIFGAAHTASATARASNVQQRLVLNYIAPQFTGNDNLNLSFSTLLDRSRDVRTFTSSRVEGTVQVGQRVNRALNLQYCASIRRVFIDEDSLNISPILIPIFSQPVRTTLFSFGLIQDRRDDPVDSTRGIFNTFDFGYAPKWLGGETNYTRLIVRNTTYHKIGRDLVFARTGTFGWIFNIDSQLLPLPERFYSGGATTHRGFPENQAGPRDPITGFPVGGEAFLFFGHELRFPLLGKNLGGVIFHDMGNVYSNLDNLSFRFRQRNLADFDYAVQAAGFGIRFKTPVGPVRIDLAYSPNTPKFFGLVGDRDDLLNGNFVFQRQRVSRFQFHFSIGQAF
jgi:outer membrane protein assembly complex protein YaeT